jgi:hypothetical protein
MDLYRLSGARIVEIRDSVDRLSMFQQLGVLTTSEPAQA